MISAVADDYRDPLASAHARIAALERENEELRHAATKRHATAEALFLTGEAEAVRCDEELLRMDMAWERRWNTGVDFDPAEVERRLARVRDVTLAAALLVAVGPALFGILPWFISICCGMLLTLAARVWTLSDGRLIREWPEHQTKRRELQRAAALARAGGGEVSPVAVRIEEPESAIAFVGDDDGELSGAKTKDRR
jgi:hypothetical protein